MVAAVQGVGADALARRVVVEAFGACTAVLGDVVLWQACAAVRSTPRVSTRAVALCERIARDSDGVVAAVSWHSAS